MNHSKRPSQSGFSLIEVLVVIGIMSIVAFSMMSMMSGMNKDFRAFDEKMGLQALQLQIQSALSNPDFCKCFFGNNTFNSSTESWNSFPNSTTSISTAYSSACAALGPPLVNIGTRIGNSNMIPTELRLEDINPVVVGGTNPGGYSAKLEVVMDPNQLTRSRKNISVPINFYVNMSDPVSYRRILSCSPPVPSFQLNDPITITLPVARNSSPMPISTSPNQYKLCILSSVRTGGNDGDGDDRCEISFSSVTRVWTISGRRGDDPAIECKMLCFPN